MKKYPYTITTKTKDSAVVIASCPEDAFFVYCKRKKIDVSNDKKIEQASNLILDISIGH